MAKEKLFSYVSKCGRQYYIKQFPSGIVVSIDITEEEVIGIFILPWYYSVAEVKSMIEFWDTEVYSQIDWNKVRSDVDLDNGEDKYEEI